MKVFITGATGFIGRHLTETLIRRHTGVVALVRPSTDVDLLVPGTTYYCDQGDTSALVSYVQEQKFDGMIHLASLFLPQHNPGDVEPLIQSNITFAARVLEAAVQAEVPWFINTGTFWQHYRNQDYSPVNFYAATKQAFEVIAQYYLETAGINFVTLKLNDTFGPGDRRPKIFHSWMKMAENGEALDMSGGEQVMDVSYIDNVIDAYVQMVDLLARDQERKFKGRSFAVRSQERMTLKELAAVFEEVTGKSLNIRWGQRDYREREVFNPWDQGPTVPGWQPRVSLREGIVKTFKQGVEHDHYR